jgi:hypothetical protein
MISNSGRKMDILLKSLEKSIRHLQIIDKVFSTENYPDKQLYLTFKREIKKLNVKYPQRFTDELYVGGKKGKGETGYGRQMILSDIYEYIVNGRGYYYAEWSIEKKKIFIEIILNLLNQLIIWDSLTVESGLRKRVLDKLSTGIKGNFFKEDEMKKRHEALRSYKGDIGFDTREETLPQQVLEKMEFSGDNGEIKKIRYRLDEYFDSLLPKTAGGLWGELIVYLYLLRRNIGYILPLLLNQRILHGGPTESLKPPDYLVIRKDGSLVGVEVGGGKETQSGRFSSALRGCQMVTVENPRVPPRCPICGKKTLFCPKVIKDYSDIDTNPLLSIKEDILCAHECNFYKYEQVLKGECPYTLYHGGTSEKTLFRQKRKFGTETDYHYHYSCIRNQKDPVAADLIKSRVARFEKKLASDGSEEAHKTAPIRVLKMNYPHVEGLETYEQSIPREEIVCYGRYPNGKNCDFCQYTEQCRKLTVLYKALADISGPKKKEAIDQIQKLFP